MFFRRIKSCFESYLLGAGSILDLSGSYWYEPALRYRRRERPNLSPEEALTKDWEKVAEDFNKSFEDFKK